MRYIFKYNDKCKDPQLGQGLGVARIFSGGHIFKNIQKSLKKNFEKFPKNFKKFSKNYKKFFLRKLLKNFTRKLLKMGNFSIFFKKVNKPSVQFFASLDEKRHVQEIFEKIFKSFLWNIAKNALF